MNGILHNWVNLCTKITNLNNRVCYNRVFVNNRVRYIRVSLYVDRSSMKWDLLGSKIEVYVLRFFVISLHFFIFENWFLKRQFWIITKHVLWSLFSILTTTKLKSKRIFIIMHYLYINYYYLLFIIQLLYLTGVNFTNILWVQLCQFSCGN